MYRGLVKQPLRPPRKVNGPIELHLKANHVTKSIRQPSLQCSYGSYNRVCVTILTQLYIVLNDIQTYHSRFISEGVAEISQIFLRDADILPK
jgi:hypothetical protein